MENNIENPIDLRINELIKNMTVVEKALLCSGRNFWYTRGIKKHGIKPYMVTDGPHGIRKQEQSSDNLGINESVKSTCFPPACTMASTWDVELISGVAKRIAVEAIANSVSIVLGPGANIKRSPLCGRNFEYYSEDPYLSGKCAAAFINGVQASGIGTSLKHYAANNQEDNRLRINAVIDERALREIYLRSFEIAVKESQPYTIMCAYNKVNGEHASQNKKLLTDILRTEWGFQGYVMTDWGAIDDRVKALDSGLELEMPGGSGESVFQIVDAVGDGRISLQTLNQAVRRLLKINFKLESVEHGDSDYFDQDEHHKYTRMVASEGAVLLKNISSVLPLPKDKPLTIIGALFENARYQGFGSSNINSTIVSNPCDTFSKAGINYKYAKGYDQTNDEHNKALVDEAINLCKSSDAPIVVFAGLTESYESEGIDRKHMSLPKNQNILIEKIISLNKTIIVILYGGAPVELPWINGVSGLLQMYLTGQACGDATYDILFGDVNPSGKLAETFPVKISDTPSFNYFPAGPATVEYRESIFVGYRYYQTIKKPVLFPFGYGLSYTSFEYSDIKLSSTSIVPGEKISVECSVKNIGDRAGKEIVQLYVHCKSNKVFRADRELQGFSKISLAVGETKIVSFELDFRSFAYYNIKENDWTIESGDYHILIGASSSDIKLSAVLNIDAPKNEMPYSAGAIGEYYSFDGSISDESFAAVLGYQPPPSEYKIEPIREITTPKEARVKFAGRIFHSILKLGMKQVFKANKDDSQTKFIQELMLTNTMRGLSTCSGGLVSRKMLSLFIGVLNGRSLLFRGIRILKAYRLNKKQDAILKQIEDED
ncbi:MAG: glycoside hydrolase family 3 C-terminal domain-containing protein [Christensenellaceae bacterium]|jgi:beta-glucosidase|nr:glycoside hydrolase family 3 C-terminal domain-containing protein [Christensenellaceae bacterium]